MNYNNQTLEKYAELMIEKIKELNSGDWEQPWFSPQFKGFPQNLNGRPYSNLNKALLYFTCDKYNYETPVFVTFNQAKENKVYILKGEKSFPVIFYDLNITDKHTGIKVDRDFYASLSAADKDKYKVVPFCRYYNVFNLNQTNYSEVYPEKWEELKQRFSIGIDISNDGYRNAIIDKTIESQTWKCPIELKFQSNAFYSPVADSITLPTMEQFSDGKEFYYTALHEMAHSTGHPERLNRKCDLGNTTEYAKEELVAELTSAVVGRDLGMAVLPRKENAQYIKSWLSTIKADPQFLFKVLNDVSKAITMVEEVIDLNQVNENHVEKEKSDILVMTEDEYLASKGYGNTTYTEPAIHKGVQKTLNQKNQLLNIHINRINKYSAERTALKEEYREKCNRGEIRQPTRTERLIKAANGHPDLESTNAARRLAMASGINWKTETNGLPEISQYYYDTKKQLHAKFYQDENMYDRFIWRNGESYILCTGSRTGGNYKEHILPPEEIARIKKLNQVEITSSGCKTLIAETVDNDTAPIYYITDSSTGKTEPLQTGNVDLTSQSTDSVQKLLAGKQTEMLSKSGEICHTRLSKSSFGWKLANEKQSFHISDFEINI